MLPCVEKTKVKPFPLPQNMTLNEFLKTRLQNPYEHVLSEEETKIIKFEGIQKFIYKKLTSTKFRKTSVDPESEGQVRNAIKLNVESNSPIKFTYPFGGYKIWRVPSYPEVDWAEFMVISYVIRYVAPILKTYEPGVEIYFSSDDVVIEQMDNYPREALDSYLDSFKSLIDEFKTYFPTNLKLGLKQVVPDVYKSLDEYKTELNQIVSDMKKEGLSQERKNKLRNVGFEFNFNPKGKTDYTNTPKEEYKKIIEELMYVSDGYLKLTKRKDFVRGVDKIVLFSNKIPNAIDIGSTSVSKAKFWAGIGIIEQDCDKYFERIMSPTQWDKNKQKATYVDLDLIKGTNFKNIPVFNERFNFLAE
ncbi:MAG: hypothetical protein ACD_24C00030G0002 [uncultured bacterium]|nr:MAG: hypothetical protein ACD_24C00030G0002 [uncultured bacterium]